MSTRTMTFDLELGIDQPFSLVSCKVSEGISKKGRPSTNFSKPRIWVT